MTATIKDRLLTAIAAAGLVADSRDLQPAAGTDQHNLIHVLYSLNRVGLVSFRLRKRGRSQLVQRIELTDRGREAVAAIESKEERGCASQTRAV